MPGHVLSAATAKSNTEAYTLNFDFSHGKTPFFNVKT